MLRARSGGGVRRIIVLRYVELSRPVKRTAAADPADGARCSVGLAEEHALTDGSLHNAKLCAAIPAPRSAL